jgi:dienelactone hydrolase
MMKKISMLFVAIILLFSSFEIGVARDNFILDVEYYPPSVESGNVAIMFFGGSEGGIPNIGVEPFTAKGYPCIKVGYFGTEHTPDKLEMIPLEYFEKAIRMFKSQPEVKGKKIVVFGSSRGGELALLLASRYKQIEGVIAQKPSFPVFQGIGKGGSSSSWSYKGQPVPFVPYYKPFDYSKVVNNQWRELFELTLTQTDVVEKAMIKVEQINGPILILNGKEDKMIPSGQMGEMIIKRLKENNFPHWYKHVAYENAGHTFSGKYLMGGTIYGNIKAKIDSEKRIFAFLSRLSGANERQNQPLQNSMLDSEEAVPKEISVAPEILSQYAGTYELEPDFNITVTLEGGRLITQMPGQDKVHVYTMSETKFFNKVEDTTVEFFKDDKGAVSHLLIFETVAMKTGYKKAPAAIDGTWIGTVYGPDGNPYEATYVFEAIDKALLGTMHTMMGGLQFSEGKIDGDKISFVVSLGATTFEWNGTVSGDEINFTQRNGERVNQFTAKRVDK